VPKLHVGMDVYFTDAGGRQSAASTASCVQIPPRRPVVNNVGALRRACSTWRIPNQALDDADDGAGASSSRRGEDAGARCRWRRCARLAAEGRPRVPGFRVAPRAKTRHPAADPGGLPAGGTGARVEASGRRARLRAASTPRARHRQRSRRRRQGRRPRGESRRDEPGLGADSCPGSSPGENSRDRNQGACRGCEGTDRQLAGTQCAEGRWFARESRRSDGGDRGCGGSGRLRSGRGPTPCVDRSRGYQPRPTAAGRSTSKCCTGSVCRSIRASSLQSWAPRDRARRRS
jgi:hypothetical protein